MCLGSRAHMTVDTWDMFFFTRLNVVRRHHVQVLHVELVPARLRHLRVVVQELEQDAVQAVTPRQEPQHAAMSDQNRAFGQKAD